MKSWILWRFDRGSFQYDVLCALILVAIFAIPPDFFNDRPEYMRLPKSGEVARSLDSDESVVFTVKADMTSSAPLAQDQALGRLQVFLEVDQLPETFRVRRIYDTRGSLIAFAFWIK